MEAVAETVPLRVLRADAGARSDAFAQPSLTQKKMRRLELQAGAPKFQGARGVWSTNDAMRQAERALAEQAELAYRRNVADWQATRPATAGASATQGHASTEPSKG